MRKGIIVGLAILLFAAIFAGIWLMPQRPRAGPWRLADGSELSLAGVTYGKKHVMRYGNGIADYLYPILSPALRKKFGCKVATFTTTNTNAIMVWFWDKFSQSPPLSRMAAYGITAVDEYGLEAEALTLPNNTTLWHSTNSLEGWLLKSFPRRSKEFRIRIYRTDNAPNAIAEFKIANRTAVRYPVWTAGPVPATAKTNGLEVKLASFETEGRGKGNSTSAQIYLTERQQPASDWSVRSVSASSATGESRSAWVGQGFSVPMKDAPSGTGLRSAVVFAGTLWREEPAWKLEVELLRKASFPTEELWKVKGVTVPAEGRAQEPNLTTNIYGSEIGFISISGRKQANNVYGQPNPIPVTLHVSSPVPSVDSHLVLVEVRDETGKSIKFFQSASMFSTGGRGATIRELDEDFELKDADDAKRLDVTLAYTKSVFVEFMARPTVAKENGMK